MNKRKILQYDKEYLSHNGSQNHTKNSRKTRHCDGKNYHFCLKQLLCSNNSAVKKNKHHINIENENE